ncbi:MAG: hypothetical protein LBH40_03075 [Alphaproteobacteria bacterium]|jgi:hypothetical protein|nr:hypothetical protein [Alphaproteobacteria bacterium]
MEDLKNIDISDYEDDDEEIQDVDDIKEHEDKEEITLEDYKRIIDFVDNFLDKPVLPNSLDNELKGDLEIIRSRKELLINRAIDKIDISDLSIDDKKKEIEKLYESSLENLEKKHGREKSKDLQNLENTSMRKIVNSFARSYRGDIKDPHKIANDFDEFLKEKAPKIVEKEIEESDIFKTYQSKLSKYVRENKATDSAFMKLLNRCTNLPTQILEQGFKEALKDSCRIEIGQHKNQLLDNVKQNLVINKKKDKGMER